MELPNSLTCTVPRNIHLKCASLLMLSRNYKTPLKQNQPAWKKRRHTLIMEEGLKNLVLNMNIVIGSSWVYMVRALEQNKKPIFSARVLVCAQGHASSTIYNLYPVSGSRLVLTIARLTGGRQTVK